MTAATEHIPTILPILVLCVYRHIYVSMLAEGHEGSGIRMYLCICLRCISVFQSRITKLDSLTGDDAFFTSSAGVLFDILMKSNLSS